jgi:hypothetical protein
MKAYKSRGIAQLILKLGSRLEWLTSCPGHFTPGERPSDGHWIEGWVDPTAGLDFWRTETFSCLYRELKPGSSRPFLGTYAYFYISTQTDSYFTRHFVSLKQMAELKVFISPRLQSNPKSTTLIYLQRHMRES